MAIVHIIKNSLFRIAVFTELNKKVKQDKLRAVKNECTLDLMKKVSRLQPPNYPFSHFGVFEKNFRLSVLIVCFAFLFEYPLEVLVCGLCQMKHIIFFHALSNAQMHNEQYSVMSSSQTKSSCTLEPRRLKHYTGQLCNVVIASASYLQSLKSPCINVN